MPSPKDFDINLAKEFIALQLLTLRVTRAYSLSRLGDAPISKEETLEVYKTMGLDKESEEVGIALEDEVGGLFEFTPELTDQVQLYLGYREDAQRLLSIYNRAGVTGVFQDRINKAEDESKKGFFRRLLKRFEETRDQAIEKGIY